MSIYQDYTPYFYIIQDVRNGMYYVGAKWAQDANPMTFMIEGGYNTSSETIKELIQQHGLSNFIIRKIRTFETGPEAYRYETRFLRKVDAKRHPRFYNMHNNDGAMDVEKMRLVMLETYGVEHPMHTEKVKSKIRDTCIEKYGVENPFQNKDIQLNIQEKNLENLGVRYPMQSKEVKEKSQKTLLKNYGVTNPSYSEDIKEKRTKTWLQKYGVANPSQSKEVKEKKRKNSLDRYGVDSYMKTEEFRTKSTQTCIEKYGVEHYSQSKEVKIKKKHKLDSRLARPRVEIIRKYQTKYKLKFGRNWSRRSDEFINELFDSLIIKYGELI